MDYTMAMDNFTGLMATSIEESIRLAEEMALEYFIQEPSPIKATGKMV